MPTVTVENYVKQIYLRQQSSGRRLVAMGGLASAMKVVPGTATTMVKALAESGLVKYEPRGGVRLTKAGHSLALHILRRHRLIELFLVQVLGLDWSEVHAEAEELEHVISERVLGRIDEFLGHPAVDPHGDPIPTARGALAEIRLRRLADCQPRQKVCVSRVSDQNPEFLLFIQRCGLRPGTRLTVQSRDPAADSITVAPQRGEPVTLGMGAAGRIFVS